MISELHIQAAWRNGKTILKNSFHTPPFKLADITEDKNDPVLYLMLMSSSPGILDNDDYKISIELDEDCSVELQTQSYQRLFQMKSGAKQELQLRMGRGSSFIFLPYPSVPHESSVFSSKNTFHLSADCLLIFGEVLTCGRKLNGEVFRFSRYHTITEIFLSGKLIVKENLMVAPALTDVNAIGQLEGYTHQASFMCVGNMFPVDPFIEDIHGLLLHEQNISFGISALPCSGFIVRLMGYKAEQLYDMLKLIALHVRTLQKKVPVNKVAYAK